MRSSSAARAIRKGSADSASSSPNATSRCLTLDHAELVKPRQERGKHLVEAGERQVCLRLHAPARVHGHRPLARVLDDRLEEPRLADARIATNDARTACACRRAVEHGREKRQLNIAAEEIRRAARRVNGRALAEISRSRRAGHQTCAATITRRRPCGPSSRISSTATSLVRSRDSRASACRLQARRTNRAAPRGVPTTQARGLSLPCEAALLPAHRALPRQVGARSVAFCLVASFRPFETEAEARPRGRNGP